MNLYTVVCYDPFGKHIQDITVPGCEVAFREQQTFCKATGGYAFVGETIDADGNRVEI